jgi:hypothetical protein
MISENFKRMKALPFVLFFILFVNCNENKTGEKLFSATVPKRISESKWKKFYKWKNSYDSSLTIYSRIDPPTGFELVRDTANNFAQWLQNLPLKPDGSAVKLYDGNLKNRQNVHFAVLDIDVGTKDLQQCADAVMRLRAEYLYGTNQQNAISFNYTSGDAIPFKKWSEGLRPVVKGNKVQWKTTSNRASDYKTFKDYLWNVFNYAGSKSLSNQMQKVSDFSKIKAGDVLIVGGFPGHAMTVVETAINKSNGKKLFLLAQSYMPAQEIHIVKNFNNESISPWFEIPEDETIDTPEWTFKKENLMQWK